MPWSQTSPMDQKTQFIADYLREVLSVTELCDLYGVSRKTACKWIDRYLTQGPAGLEDRSRRPRGRTHGKCYRPRIGGPRRRTVQVVPGRDRRVE